MFLSKKEKAILLLQSLLVVSYYFSDKIFEFAQESIAKNNSSFISINKELASPISLQELTNKNLSYINIEFKFKNEEFANNYQNLFQTAPSNEGARIELHGSTLVAVFRNANEKGAPIIHVITDTYKTGVFHHLTFSMLKNSFIYSKLDDRAETTINKNIAPKTNDIKIGTGFDNTRNYRGVISEVNITYSENQNYFWVQKILYILFFVSLLFYIFILENYISNKLKLQNTLIRNTIRLVKQNAGMSKSKYLNNIIKIKAIDGFINLQKKNQKLLLTFSCFLIIASLIYIMSSLFFESLSDTIVLGLLPGFKRIQSYEIIKKEIIFFVLLMGVFVSSLFLSSIAELVQFRVPFRYGKFIRKIFIFALFMQIVAIICADDVDKYYLESFIFLSILCLILFYISKKLLQKTDYLYEYIIVTLSIRNMFRPTIKVTQSLIKIIPSDKKLITNGILILISCVVLLPGIYAWYPIRLPNDYLEILDSRKKNLTESVVRDINKLGIDEKETSLKIDKNAILNDINGESSYLWKSAVGRILFHHSYIFVPAMHWNAYGFDHEVPYLYGIGNTISHALLLKIWGLNLTTYFNTYPITLIFSILAISIVVGYCAQSIIIFLISYLLALSLLYCIPFEAALLAASFNPMRYIGISVQVASVYFVLRGGNYRLFLLPLAAIFSLIWNFEFGCFGLVAQFLVVLSTSLLVTTIYRIFNFIILLVILIYTFYLSRPSINILSSISLGFFQINMPELDESYLSFLPFCAGLVIIVLMIYNNFDRSIDSIARTCTLPTIYFTLIKAVYNPSKPHLIITLIFLVPMLLHYIPREYFLGPYRARLASKPLTTTFIPIFLMIICVENGLIYHAQSQSFRETRIYPFQENMWTELKENIPIITPEKDLLERVAAIKKELRPNEKLLILSPFDHILSFYLNPSSFCGHFDIMSNLATSAGVSKIIDCVNNDPGVLVVFDQALEVMCPISDDKDINNFCEQRQLVKGNLKKLYEVINKPGRLVYQQNNLLFSRNL